MVTVSGWLSARMVKRDFPPNMREIGELTEFTYSRPCIRRQRQA